MNFLPEQVTAIIDTREQRPFELAPMACRPGTLATGDYSVSMMEDQVCLERKELPDLIACCGPERERFERELQGVDNVTIHLFLYPILSAESIEKSKHIWCAKDKGKAWQDWMVRDQLPKVASCDSAAITRNVEIGRKYKITGTPTLIFADGTRVPGAIGAADVEKYLTTAKN